MHDERPRVAASESFSMKVTMLRQASGAMAITPHSKDTCKHGPVQMTGPAHSGPKSYLEFMIALAAWNHLVMPSLHSLHFSKKIHKGHRASRLFRFTQSARSDCPLCRASARGPGLMMALFRPDFAAPPRARSFAERGP